jgi:hypothetical protein
MIQFENCFKYFDKKFFSYLSKEKYKDESQRNPVWIAGGSVRDYFSGVTTKTDIDVFCVSEKIFNYIIEDMNTNGATVVFENENTTRYLLNKTHFDIVKKFYNYPTDCIDSFDFTVSMFAVGYNGEVFHGSTSFMDLAKKQIMINKITYPLSTLHRLLKYQNKGFRICKGELFKIAVSINEIEKLKKEVAVEEIKEINDADISPVSVNKFEALFMGID